MVLWCGNNEEETAWKDWGHGRDLKAADPAFAAKVWQGYVDLFGNDLRQVVSEDGLGVPYWSSSPSNDVDEKANDSTRGDKHYWQVWGNPALPVQVGAYFLVWMLGYGVEMGWTVSGTHPLNMPVPPKGGYIEADRAEGKDLLLWHHLVCGDPQAVHHERISQSGRMLSENSVAEDDWEDYLIFRSG